MLKNEEFARYARYYAHLPPDAIIDQRDLKRLLRRALWDAPRCAEYLLTVRCTPHLLQEFMAYHWNDTLSRPVGSPEMRLAQRVMEEINRLKDENERAFALRCFADGYTPPLRTLRKVCAAIEERR